MTPDIPYNARVTPEQQNCANHGSAMHVHGVRGRAPSGISARFPTFEQLQPSPAIKGLGRKLEMIGGPL